MENIELERTGSVAHLWLNRPERLNAINQTTLDELGNLFPELDRDTGIRAIILAARGTTFSAGFDIEWMVSQTPESVGQSLAGVRRVFNQIEFCSKPVVAAIDGSAVGGGLLLAMVSDFRVATERSTFAVPEVKIGIFPSLNLVPRLERLVGLAAAKRLVLTGWSFDSAQAEQAGLIDEVVRPDQLMGEARRLAEHLASLPPLAVQSSKLAFQAARQTSYDDWETKQFAACWAAPEREAAMRAFLKR